MICRHCNADFGDDSAAYIQHMESLIDAGATPEGNTVPVEGLADSLSRQYHGQRRLEKPSDFGILGQD